MPDTGSRGPDPWKIVQGTEVLIPSEHGGSFELHRALTPDGMPLVFGKAVGVLDRASLSETMRTIIHDPRFGPRLPTLWDLRHHDFDRTPVVHFRGYAFVFSEFPERRGIRRGYLVANDTGYGMMRMFQQLASGYGLEDESRLRVSSDADRLLHWLAPGTPQPPR